MAQIHETWLLSAVSSQVVYDHPDGVVGDLRDLLQECAEEFAVRRADVATSVISWPRRGLLPDEAASFLRAVRTGFAHLDDAGYVTLPTVRPKLPEGRYALLSKSGAGVSINLEYLIQIGATAELVLDHGWPPEAIDFERGEFDALGSGPDGRVVLAMEAKARTTGSDSLEKLLRFWIDALATPTLDLNTNAGRKLRELTVLCGSGPVTVWLVAEGARWSLDARQGPSGVELMPGPVPEWSHWTSPTDPEAPVDKARPYDPGFHRPGTKAAAGECSQHGIDSCSQQPVISFVDRNGRRQSGCQRALEELAARGEVTVPHELRGGTG